MNTLAANICVVTQMSLAEKLSLGSQGLILSLTDYPDGSNMAVCHVNLASAQECIRVHLSPLHLGQLLAEYRGNVTAVEKPSLESRVQISQTKPMPTIW